MRCNVGIAPNRFLAKTAAGLHKPDGLDIIDHNNLRQTLAGMELTDLTGIAERNQARLNAAGYLYTFAVFGCPATAATSRRVFKSVCGEFLIGTSGCAAGKWMTTNGALKLSAGSLLWMITRPLKRKSAAGWRICAKAPASNCATRALPPAACRFMSDTKAAIPGTTAKPSKVRFFYQSGDLPPGNPCYSTNTRGWTM